MAEEPPNVIVFGGCGFIGRNLVHYLITNSLASYVRVVDKVPPQVAWLNKKHQVTFNDPRVEFKSANLINPASCEASFSNCKFDYAINCACETKLGQSEPVYEEGVYKLGMNCAKAAAAHPVRRYIEVSTNQMWSDRRPRREDDKVEPWTPIAKYKCQLEEGLKSIPNLHYCVLRPAIVYGPGDKSAMGGKLVIPGLYRIMGVPMKLLSSEEVGMNTLHVEDASRAIWHLATSEAPEGVYHVADDADSMDRSLMTTIGSIYKVVPENLSSFVSPLIQKMDLSEICEEVNDMLADAWAQATTADGVMNTPLSPYVYPEFLLNRSVRLDSSKIKKTGFVCAYPHPTPKLFKDILEDYISMNVFPKSLLP